MRRIPHIRVSAKAYYGSLNQMRTESDQSLSCRTTGLLNILDWCQGGRAYTLFTGTKSRRDPVGNGLVTVPRADMLHLNGSGRWQQSYSEMLDAVRLYHTQGECCSDSAEGEDFDDMCTALADTLMPAILRGDLYEPGSEGGMDVALLAETIISHLLPHNQLSQLVRRWRSARSFCNMVGSPIRRSFLAEPEIPTALRALYPCVPFAIVEDDERNAGRYFKLGQSIAASVRLMAEVECFVQSLTMAVRGETQCKMSGGYEAHLSDIIHVVNERWPRQQDSTITLADMATEVGMTLKELRTRGKELC